MQVVLSFPHRSGLCQGLALAQVRVLYQELGTVLLDVLVVELLQRCLLLAWAISESASKDCQLMLTQVDD